MMRRRASFFVSAAVTVLIGLAVFFRAGALDPGVRDVTGDALWAMMIVWFAGVLAPNARIAARSISAYAVCLLVELSQLYHSPLLDSLRATTIGHLVLGNGFDARDLAAYAAGVVLAALIELVIIRDRITIK